MGRIGCCKCHTLYYVVKELDEHGEVVLDMNGNPSLVVDWSANFFFDTDPNHPWTAGGWHPNVTQCDVDADGNVYQAGGPSSPLIDPLLGLYQHPMYTLRSWDKTGEYRWSWSEGPSGVLVGSTLFPPSPLLGCRVGADGANQFVIVGDSGAPVTGLVRATKLALTDVLAMDGTVTTAEGTVLWRVSIESGARLVGVGATRSLWWRTFVSGSSSPSAGWILLDNATGATTANVSPQQTATGIGGINAGFNYDTSTVVATPICATIDTDDTVYAVVQIYTAWRGLGGTNNPLNYGLCKYSLDSTTPTATVMSLHFGAFNNGIGYSENRKLGNPTSIVLTETSIVVGGPYGWETFDKTSFTSTSTTCRHLSTQPYGNNGFFYADDESETVAAFGLVSNIYSAPSIYKMAGDEYAIWQAQNDPLWVTWSSPVGFQDNNFVDARPIAGGFSIWSQNYTCFAHALVVDTTGLSTTCLVECCAGCFGASVDGVVDCVGNAIPMFVAANVLVYDYVYAATNWVCRWDSASYNTTFPGGDGNGTGLKLTINPTTGTATLTASSTGTFNRIYYPPQTVNGEVFALNQYWQYEYLSFGGATYTCTSFDCATGGVFTLQSSSMTTQYWRQDYTQFWSVYGSGVTTLWHQVLLSTATCSGNFPATVTVAPAACNQTIDGQSICRGFQAWVSVASGSSFVWQSLGVNSCEPGCTPPSPVTVPASAGLSTATFCQ